jgi:hypothetical protein
LKGGEFAWNFHSHFTIAAFFQSDDIDIRRPQYGEHLVTMSDLYPKSGVVGHRIARTNFSNK